MAKTTQLTNNKGIKEDVDHRSLPGHPNPLVHTLVIQIGGSGVQPGRARLDARLNARALHVEEEGQLVRGVGRSHGGDGRARREEGGVAVDGSAGVE